MAALVSAMVFALVLALVSALVLALAPANTGVYRWSALMAALVSCASAVPDGRLDTSTGQGR